MNNAVIFTKGRPSDSAGNRDPSVSALIVIGGAAVPGKLAIAKPYVLYGLQDAKEIGIDPAYDMNYSVVLFHHIQEFYRANQKGAKLYLIVLPANISPSEVLKDPDALYARKLITFAKGEIRQLALAYNPVVSPDKPEVITDGFNGEIRGAIAKAQELAVWAFETERPLQILLEGRAYNGNPAGAVNLKELTTGAGVALNAEKVSVVIAQDWDYAQSLPFAAGKKYASVGLALGVLSAIKVNRNIGEVETLNLTNAITGKYVTAGLSSHQTVEDAEAGLPTLDIKGYIFPVAYTGISGYRFNNDHVCAPEIVDKEAGIINESSIAYGRTMDEAVRRLRRQLLPKIKSVQPADKTTGKLPVGVVKSFNAKADEVFHDMQAEGLISSGKTNTNPDSDLLTGEKALEITFDLQPTGTINKIKGTINLKKSL